MSMSSLIRQRFVLRSKKLLCTSTTKPPGDARGEQSKGAMKSYFKNVVNPANPTGLWAKLRQDANSDAQAQRSWKPKSTTSVAPLANSNQAPSTGGRPPYRPNRNTSEGSKKRRDKFGGGDSMSPTMKALLFEFDGLDVKGKQVNTRGMDDIDKFFAEAYVDSMKIESGIVRSVVQLPNYHRTQIPKPRPISQLVESLTPNVTGEGLGLELGLQAWQVLTNNIYYTDAERRYMAQQISSQATRREGEYTEDDPQDLLFTEGFRRGFDGLEEEKKRKAMMEGVGTHDDGEYIQGDTDWNVDAVIDEDELFGSGESVEER